MAELTWLTRERPILEAIDARTRSARSGTRSGDIGKDTGLDELEIDVALRDLEGALYVSGVKTHVFGMTKYENLRLLEKGLREVGRWPASSYDAFLAVLDDQIGKEPDAEQRTRLQSARDAVASVGRDVLVNVLSTVGSSVVLAPR